MIRIRLPIDRASHHPDCVIRVPNADVAGFDRDVGAGANSDAKVRLGQGRSIVDAVTHERHPCALPLELADLVRLFVREDLSQHFLDSKSVGYCSRGFPVVARIGLGAGISDIRSLRPNLSKWNLISRERFSSALHQLIGGAYEPVSGYPQCSHFPHSTYY